ITDIGLPTDADDPHVFWVDDEAETVLYFAGDGALLERRATAGGLMRALFRLHTGEIVGLPGQGLSLLAGVGALGLVATGLGMIASRRKVRG
ncbi:MAG TPA: PepSY domain-containing protein, partial [Nannocystis sp.]